MSRFKEIIFTIIQLHKLRLGKMEKFSHGPEKNEKAKEQTKYSQTHVKKQRG